MQQIGKRRYQIKILQPISTARSTDGEPIFTYSTILKNIWASVETVTAHEAWRNDYRWAIADKLFNIRYTTISITPDMIINYSSENYQIQNIIDIGEKHHEFEIIGRKTT